MSITLLRWKAGSGGDTILKMLLESNPQLHCQNRYLSLVAGKTTLDPDYVDSFKYPFIGKMSRLGFDEVDQDQLFQELNQLDLETPHQQWLLKTHCYFDFTYPVIDLTVDHDLMPFVVKSNLIKNHRNKKLMSNYHSIISKIKDPVVLYKFDCYNVAVDLLKVKYGPRPIALKEILAGWNVLVNAISNQGLYLDKKCKGYYDSWAKTNEQFVPSTEYKKHVLEKNYNYHNKSLSIEERYCLLALAQEKFCLLN